MTRKSFLRDRRRPLLGRAVAAAAFFLGAVAPAPAAVASASSGARQTRTVTVADAAEAWYAMSPIDLCSLPIGGCAPRGPSALSAYPADTLHVGVLAGKETARTYLLPDLSALPAGSTAVSGTMTLPVGTAPRDLTVSASTAVIKACLATQHVVQGSTAAAPTIDCSTSRRLTYRASSHAFTLDLTPFLAAWTHGKAADGIALLPDATASKLTDIWQVTFNGRQRAAAPHIRSRLVVQSDSKRAQPTATTSAVQQSPPTPAPDTPRRSLGSVDLPPAAEVTPGTAAVPVVAAPPNAPTARTASGVANRGFQYPAVFLLPVGLAALAMFMIRLFTRDFTPTRRQAPRT